MTACYSVRELLCDFPGCGRTFFNLLGLKKHTRIKHAYSFYCPQCFVCTATLPRNPSSLIDLPSSPPQLHAEFDDHANPDVDFNLNDPVVDPPLEIHGQPFTELHPFINSIPINHHIIPNLNIIRLLRKTM
jgi:hypothetical protein